MSYYIWTPDWQYPEIVDVSTPENWYDFLLLEGRELNQPLADFCFSVSDSPPPDVLVSWMKFIVCSVKLRNVIQDFSQDPVQFLDVEVVHHETKEQFPGYTLCNPLVKIEAIDHSRSSIVYGHKEVIRGVDKLVLSEEQVNGHTFFRLSGIPPFLVVHESLVHEVMESGCTGVLFLPIDEFKL
jgi:hypothetical protein